MVSWWFLLVAFALGLTFGQQLANLIWRPFWLGCFEQVAELEKKLHKSLARELVLQDKAEQDRTDFENKIIEYGVLMQEQRELLSSMERRAASTRKAEI
jgi:hypothetical protein